MSTARVARKVLMRLLTDRAFGVDLSSGRPAEIVDAIQARFRTPSGAAREELDRIAAAVAVCRDCPLAQGRTRAVPGEGRPDADLVFIGEGPGKEEDRSGRPFVGKAGQLLTRIIEAMGLARDDVFIANVVKCRPPGNRAPAPGEVLACRPHLEAQLAAMQPVVIVALGAAAAQALLGTARGISSLRGRFHDRGGIRVMPTFHPAYLLRSPQFKGQVWKDMKKVLAELGLSVPEGGKGHKP
jgi:DNA polymerase